MAFIKTQIKYPKLTTAAAMMFGAHATQNYLNLDQQQVWAYVNRHSFNVSTEQSQHCTEEGYVLVRYQDFVMGVGLYLPNPTGQGGVVHSMFPKGWSPIKNANP